MRRGLYGDPRPMHSTDTVLSGRLVIDTLQLVGFRDDPEPFLLDAIVAEMSKMFQPASEHSRRPAPDAPKGNPWRGEEIVVALDGHIDVPKIAPDPVDLNDMDVWNEYLQQPVVKVYSRAFKVGELDEIDGVLRGLDVATWHEDILGFPEDALRERGVPENRALSKFGGIQLVRVESGTAYSKPPRKQF